MTLQVLAGPSPGPFRVEGETPATIGRSATCDVSLPDDTVSRCHAVLVRKRGAWFIEDGGSRSGTLLNGVRLPKGMPAPLATGDILRIGPWAFRVVVGALPTTSTARTIDDTSSRTQRIERLGTSRRTSVSDRRLAHLSECIRRLGDALDEPAAASVALELALRGSGYARGAVLRRVAGGQAVQVEIVAASAEGLEFSRTLLEQAATGESALLTEDAEPVRHGQSLAELGVHSALCVPVAIDGPVTGFLYLDARGREAAVHADAAGYCEAVATALGLAIGALRRAEVERRRHDMQTELEAAREVQTLIMPDPVGTIGPMVYAVRSRPGKFVAGDLVDVLDLGAGRTAVCIGDVAGHGVGAAMLMATARAFLAAELQRLHASAGPAAAVTATNRFLASRPLAGRFLSLWVGILHADGTLRYTDAGHGHWFIVKRCGNLRSTVHQHTDGGIPVGIDPDAAYGEASLILHPRDEVVVYSDGIIEQRGPEGVFGVDRLLEQIIRGQSPDEDVRFVFDALEAFAGTPAWDDDATVAAVEFLGPE
ncbi:MAG: hypothetical protein HBSAPP03_18990 [Phycisphaerae bacterium]|nr:MAG: hypothetical protein HBSAPP03_18990 [Phycisphaerae bacterium]